MDKIEEVKKILESMQYELTHGACIVDKNRVTAKICQLFEPKPDEGRLLTPEEIIIAVCGDCPFEGRFSDEDCHACQQQLSASAKAQDTNTASIYETLLKAKEALCQMRVEKAKHEEREEDWLFLKEYLCPRCEAIVEKLEINAFGQALKNKEIPDKEK